MLSKKKQVLTMAIVAVTYLLVGTTINAMTMATDGGKPFGEMWKAIHDLRTQVNEIENKPEVKVVTGNPRNEGWHELNNTLVNADLLSIPNVTVAEDSKVFAIATAYFYCPTIHPHAINLTHRANSNFGEYRFQGWDTLSNQRNMLEVHHLWSDPTAGTYTFAITCFLYVGKIYVANSRLTLVIF